MSTPPPTRLIGIIGPPCSGKSTVAQYLQSLGGVWLDADKIAKEQLDNSDVITELVDSFGRDILARDGSLSRSRIADLVFGEDEESQARLKQLESVIHPRTRTILRERIEQAICGNRSLVILDVPLLLESGWAEDCDEVWCLSISPQRHEHLLTSRGWSADELARREKRQLPWDEKRRRSDWIIENDGSVEELQRKVKDRLIREG